MIDPWIQDAVSTRCSDRTARQGAPSTLVRMADDDRWGSRAYMDAYRKDDLGSPAHIPDPQHLFIWVFRTVIDAGRWIFRKARR